MHFSFLLVFCFFIWFSSHAFEKFPSIEQMSLEEKVGQLLMVHFNGKNVNEESQKLIQQAHVGGIIYYDWANQLENPYQVYMLSHGLQNLALKQPGGIPLFISTDHEGGRVNRLKKGFTLFPGNGALGQTHQAALARASAIAMGKELGAVGINMILGPVVDINNSLNNPVIGIRSYSADPKEVTHFARHTLNGFHKVGIIPVIKHFPGHGDTEADSHEKLPVIKHSKKHLDQIELYPFSQLHPWVDVIMTSHLHVLALDDENPITFSQKAVEDLLRNQWKFGGVIMTDSLVMQGIMEMSSSIDEAVIKSIEAGHDIVLLGGKQLLESQKGFELDSEDILRIHQSVVTAVQSGRIKEERINASVKRILKLKEDYQIHRISDFVDVTYCVNTPEHQQLAKQIAEESVCLASNQLPIPISLDHLKVGFIAPQQIKDQIEKTNAQKLGKENRILYLHSNPSEIEIQQASELASWADIVFVCSLEAWKNQAQVQMIHKIQRKQLIILIVGNPQDVAFYINAGAVVWTFSPTHYSIQAALDLLLKGRS